MFSLFTMFNIILHVALCVSHACLIDDTKLFVLDLDNIFSMIL
jgi:hypothetical protein